MYLQKRARDAAMRIVPVLAAVVFTLSLHAATSLEVVLPDHTTTGVAFDFTVTAKSGATTDTAYTGTVHFTSNETTATLPADYTYVLGDAGTHTFSMTFNRSHDVNAHDTFLVNARDTVNNTIAGSDITDVAWAAGIPRHLTLDVSGEITRTVPYDFPVTVQDAYGAIVTSYTGTVHFKSTGGIIQPADYTFTPADAGRHTFSATSNDGGYNLITVEDTVDPTINGGDNFTVNCPELVVNAGNTGPVCPGTSATLYASSNEDGVQFSWAGPAHYWGWGETTLAYRPGIYTLLGSQPSNSCSSIAQTELKNKSVTPLTASPSSTTVCPGGHVTITLTNGASFSSINWQPPSNATIVSGQGTPTLEIEAGNDPNQTILVYVQANDDVSGCPASELAAQIHIGTANAQINTPAASCPRATLSAAVPDGGPSTTYAWSITNGTILGGQGTRLIAYKTGDGDPVTVSVTVTNASCSDSDTAIVSVNGPTATVSGTFNLCAGDQAAVPVTLAGTPPFHILWSDGVVQDNVMTTSTTRTITATESNTYSIALVSDASCTGIASGTAEVVVQDSPQITEQPHSGSISRGDRVTLSVHALGNDLRYDWYEGRSGERTHLVQSGPSNAYLTPQLQDTTRYWVEVVSTCGASQSHTATLGISNRHRSVRH